MEFAFYNETGDATLGSRLFSPARRAARRLLRPTFYRLRDILERLAAEQAAAGESARDLARRLAKSEAGLAQARAEIADFRGRVADARAEIAAFHARVDDCNARLAEGLALLAAARTETADFHARLADARAETAEARSEVARLRKAHDLARPLATDYNSLALRVDEVEDRLVKSLAAPAARAA